MLPSLPHSHSRTNTRTHIHAPYKIFATIEFGYFALSTIAGVILILFDRRPSRNDFDAHWSRAQQVASFQFLSTPDPSGSGDYGAISADGYFVPFNNTAINSPFAYLPSMLSGGHLRVACALTLIVAVGFTTLAIHIAGQYKTLILGIAVLPIVFFSYLYPTADAMTNSFSLLFVAQILYLLQKESIRWKDISLLALSALYLGQLKITLLCTPPSYSCYGAFNATTPKRLIGECSSPYAAHVFPIEFGLRWLPVFHRAPSRHPPIMRKHRWKH